VGETWLETNYETEGERALEMTVEQLKLVLADPYRWKWIIIALHNALQAFLVHVVSGSSQNAATEFVPEIPVQGIRYGVLSSVRTDCRRWVPASDG